MGGGEFPVKLDGCTYSILPLLVINIKVTDSLTTFGVKDLVNLQDPNYKN